MLEDVLSIRPPNCHCCPQQIIPRCSESVSAIRNPSAGREIFRCVVDCWHWYKRRLCGHLAARRIFSFGFGKKSA